jgi:hypothetical protein
MVKASKTDRPARNGRQAGVVVLAFIKSSKQRVASPAALQPALTEKIAVEIEALIRERRILTQASAKAKVLTCSYNFSKTNPGRRLKLKFQVASLPDAQTLPGGKLGAYRGVDMN